jgi:hypothetical protein
MERMRLRLNMPGPKPKFRHEENGVYVIKDRKGGINWYRHQDEVLKPHLLPFACECRQGINGRKDTIVIEDRASSHKSVYSDELYIS